MATEETEKTVRNQQDAMRRMAATFDQFANGHGRDMNGQRPDGQERREAEMHGGEQRVAGAQAAQQAAAKQQPGRKES
jgi:hypothetical protein